MPPPRTTRRILLALVAVLLPVAFCCSWWNQSPDFVWALLRDSRAYPPVDALHLTKGTGDLEEDLLPHFQVKLPCDTQHLRYGEWEDFGPAGWLALRFDTSTACLDGFVRDNGLRPATENLIPVHRVPAEYGWQLDQGNTNYRAEPSGPVRLAVSVDTRSTRPVVHVFSTYY